MKVLWFTNTMMPEFAEAIGLSKGNTGGWMPSLLEAVRKFAPDVKLAIACEGPLGAHAEVNGIEYFALGRGMNKRTHEINASFIQSVCECLDKIQPDIVHVHGSEGPFAGLPREIWNNQRLTVSIQGIISAYWHEYYGNLSESDFSPFRNRMREILRGYSLRNDCDYWKHGRADNEVALLNVANLVVGRTDWDRAWVRYINQKVAYKYVGEVLRPPFYAGRRNEETVVPHSIYCGAALVYPLKNGHVAIEAVARLKEKYPDVKVHFANSIAVGAQPNWLRRLREGEYVRYLRDLISRLDVRDNIVFHPSLSDVEVRALLEKTEVFCLPSACENSPNSLGEAMMTGVPSVATYVGGVPSILENGKEGLLVPSGDPASLAAAIDRMFTDKDYARTCAQNAYETAVKRYDPQAVVGQLLSAYKEVAK